MHFATHKKTAAIAVAMLAIGAGAVHAATDTGGNGKELGIPGPFDSTSKTQITAVQSDQSASFAVFHREHTQTDTIPEEARALLGETELTGKNPELARAISSNAGTAWAIPGDGTICIALPDPQDTVVLGCSSTSDAKAHGAFAIEIAPSDPDTALVGLVLPDGGQATATFADHQEPLSASKDGTVLASLKDAESVTVTTPSGERTIAIPTPAALAAGNNG